MPPAHILFKSRRDRQRKCANKSLSGYSLVSSNFFISIMERVKRIFCSDSRFLCAQWISVFCFDSSYCFLRVFKSKCRNRWPVSIYRWKRALEKASPEPTTLTQTLPLKKTYTLKYSTADPFSPNWDQWV